MSEFGLKRCGLSGLLVDWVLGFGFWVLGYWLWGSWKAWIDFFDGLGLILYG